MDLIDVSWFSMQVINNAIRIVWLSKMDCNLLCLIKNTDDYRDGSFLCLTAALLDHVIAAGCRPERFSDKMGRSCRPVIWPRFAELMGAPRRT